MIYLDNSATTQVDQDVAGIACEVMTEVYGNPSSPYLLGRDALGRLTAARQQVAQVIGAPTGRSSLHQEALRPITWPSGEASWLPGKRGGSGEELSPLPSNILLSWNPAGHWRKKDTRWYSSVPGTGGYRQMM